MKFSDRERMNVKNLGEWITHRKNLLRKTYDDIEVVSGLNRATLFRIMKGHAKPRSNTIKALETSLGKIDDHIKEPSKIEMLFRLTEIVDNNTEYYDENRPTCFYSERGCGEIATLYFNCHQEKIFGGISQVKTAFHSLCLKISYRGIAEEKLNDEPDCELTAINEIYTILQDGKTSEGDIHRILNIICNRLFKKDFGRSVFAAYKLVKFIELISMSYSEILNVFIKQYGMSQSELARELNTTQNMIWSIVSNKNEYVNTKLCKQIYDLYFQKTIFSRWRTMEQRQERVDTKIDKASASHLLKRILLNCGYEEEDFNSKSFDYSQKFLSHPYITQAQNQMVSCDLLLGSSNSPNKIACFFKFKPIIKKQIMHYLFIAQELGATHVVFMHGLDKFKCIQVHSWPPFFTDIPQNKYSLDFRMINERHIFSSLDSSIIREVEKAKLISRSSAEYESRLSKPFNKFKSNTTMFSNDFSAFHLQMGHAPQHYSKGEIDGHTEILWRHPPLYGSYLMIEASNGTENEGSILSTTQEQKNSAIEAITQFHTAQPLNSKT
jgi:transcriptional regulator with XRE-family HTH domain